jgi:hypothetical protein
MPNLTINADEAAAIVRYVEAQSAHADHTATPAPAAVETPAAATAVAPLPAVASALIDPAIAIQIALAHDALDGLPAKALTLARAAAALGPPAAAIANAATDLSHQAGLDEARTAFGAVSDALLAYLREQKLSPPAGVRNAYCPMLRKSWLQRDGAINNPYYGRKMLECGGFAN